MKRYRLQATLRSPVVVREDRQSQRSAATASLSGSVVRGALANLYLQRHDQVDERFRRLFLDESACRFGPLDPAVHTLPATAVSCKRHPGFLAGKEGTHGMADQLWSRIAARLARRANLAADSVLPRTCRHPNCGHDLKPQDGFWEQGKEGPQLPATASKRLDMHVGIDRQTHTAAEEILYSLEAFDPVGNSGTLVGWIDATDEVKASLQELLAKTEGMIRVGHARTRGYGRVHLEFVEEVPVGATDWDRWSQDLHQLLAALRKTNSEVPLLNPERHFFFSLSLPTGAVLVDDLLRATLDPSFMTSWLPPLPPARLDFDILGQQGITIDGAVLRCVTAVAHHERTRGWNAAHGLPRQDEWTVARGAVYVYLAESDDPTRTTLQKRLAKLEQEGTGARRNEGLGRVVVSDPFHRDFPTQEQRKQS